MIEFILFIFFLIDIGVLNYRKDFDRYGVIYVLGINFGIILWVNLGSNSVFLIRIIVMCFFDE